MIDYKCLYEQRDRENAVYEKYCEEYEQQIFKLKNKIADLEADNMELKLERE